MRLFRPSAEAYWIGFATWGVTLGAGSALRLLILFDTGWPRAFQWGHFGLGLGYDVMTACVLALAVHGTALGSVRVARPLAMTLVLALLVFNYVDFCYFREFRTHLPFSTVEYLRHASDFGSSVQAELGSGYAIVLLLLPALAAAWLLLCARRAAHRMSCRRHALALGGTLLVGLTANTISNSYVGRNLADPLQFTPLQHFVYTVHARADQPARLTDAILARLRAEDPGHPLLQRQRWGGCGQPAPAFRELCQDVGRLPGPPNIVFVMLESFRAQELGALGAPPGLSPRFDTLARHGVLFTRFYGNGFQTRDGLESSYCSLYPNAGAAILNAYPTVRQRCLPELLRERGYATAWVHNGDADFDNRRQFLLANGVQRVVDRWDFPIGTERLGWGESDEALMQRAVQVMADLPQPFFAGLLTITNHHPFQVPARFRTHRGRGEYSRYLDGIAYTDYALGRLFDLARQQPFFRNTVFFIYADHSVPQPPAGAVDDVQSTLDWRHRIPLLVVADGLQHGQRVATPDSQVDLPPLVLDLLGAQHLTWHEELPWRGHSPLRGGSQPVLMVIPDAHLGLVTGSGAAEEVGGQWHAVGNVAPAVEQWAHDVLLAGRWALEQNRVAEVQPAEVQPAELQPAGHRTAEQSALSIQR